MNNFLSLNVFGIVLCLRSGNLTAVEISTAGSLVELGQELDVTDHDDHDGSHTSLGSNIPSDFFEERCLRRFSPGTCAEPVHPVYTYTYHQHNCTQRLGCIVSSRTNRFKSYTNCARVCQGYMDLWSLLNTNGLRSKASNKIRSSQIFRMARERSTKDRAYIDVIEYEDKKRQHELSLTRSQYEPSDLHDSVYGGAPPQKFESYL